MSEAITPSAGTFKQVVLGSEVPPLVDYWAA
jgi:hypothetical protein